MTRSILLALALLAIIPITDMLADEAYRADHPAIPARKHEQTAYTFQQIAALDSLAVKPDDILEFGRRNATTRAGRHYSQKEAASLIAKIWHIGVE